MPTVQPSREAMLTIWSVVCTAFGRRIFGIASMSSTRANILMPMTVVFRRKQAVEIGDHAGEVELFRCLLLHGVISLAA